MLWDKRIRFVLEWQEDELKPNYAIVFTVNENCDLTSYERVDMPGKRRQMAIKERQLNQTMNAVDRQKIVLAAS